MKSQTVPPMIWAADAEPSSLRLAATVPVEFQAAAAGENKRPTFSIVGYTGAPMSVEGFFSPVILDMTGLKAASQTIPAFRGHDPDRVVGQTDSVKIGEQATFTGIITGDNDDTREILTHARNGFKWQASVGASIERREFLESGKTATVNGRQVAGPMVIVREGTVKEISFVPLGADGQTSASVAASTPPGTLQGTNAMSFEQWLQAKGFDPAAVNANDSQRAFLKVQYDAEHPAAPAQPAPATPPPATPAHSPAPTAVQANGGGPVNSNHPSLPGATLDSIFAEARQEQDRQEQIVAMTRVAIRDRPMMVAQLEDLSKAAIRDGVSASDYEVRLLRIRASAPGTGGFAIHAGDGHAASADVIEVAICRSAGLRDMERHFGERALTAADRSFRHGIGLKQVLQIAARENGRADVSPNDIRGMLEGAFIKASSGFSTISLPGILSNAANKFVVEAFMAAEQTWRSIASTRPVNDFKSIASYSLTGDLMYEELGPTGEIKHGTLGETTYANQAKSYAKMLAITRTDIINDDLGVFASIPRRLGRGAALKINDVFWTKFLAGVGSFWAAGNNNLITGGGTVLSSAALKTATTTFRKQTDPDDQPLAVTPRILLVPPELEVTADELMTSVTINSGGAATDAQIPNANVWRSKFRVASSAYLSNTAYTGNSTTAWWLLADPNDIPTIEVAFLNGREMPIVESADADFNTLGVQFRGVHDFGCALMEFRGSVRSAGA